MFCTCIPVFTTTTSASLAFCGVSSEKVHHEPQWRLFTLKNWIFTEQFDQKSYVRRYVARNM
jgi:hypothetical protein